VRFEGEDAMLQLGEVVGGGRGQHLALDEPEVNLLLVEPGCVDWSVHQDEIGYCSLSLSTAFRPRCEEQLSTIQKTRPAER
jgi:hypothetical protein